MVLPNAISVWVMAVSCDATINSKTSTASRAPIGSMTIPSQRKILAKFVFGRTVLSMGTITVGPVTVTMAPNRKDSCQVRSRL